MGGLAAFLRGNAGQVANRQLVLGTRFVTEDGSAAVWELRGITAAEDEALRVGCRVTGGAGRGETDYALYLGRLAAACVVTPDLDDAALQDSYGVMGSDVLLKTMLTPGEYSELLGQVQALCGFDVTMEQKVCEAKNS